MARDTRFWTLLLVFQVFFGLAVFAITREYYMPDTPAVQGRASISGQPATSWSRGVTATDISRLSSPGLVESAPDDPAEIYRQAEEFFAARQYDRAAHLYEQLLPYSPNDAEIYNNLGLTLFYVGRSEEALRRLNEGVAVDPEHQRIWLTLGYVNSQLGNTEEARAALTKATQVGGNASVRESAEKMLAELP
jgi:tetratricopeptide (TPR) repeat protein